MPPQPSWLTPRRMALAAVMVALLAALAQVAIPLPFSPVPITGQVLGIFLAGGILGSRTGALVVLVYVLLGAIGLPVFARGGGGLSVLAGPTGGYIWGFIPGVYLLGRVAGDGDLPSYPRLAAGMAAGLLAVYALGTLQLALLLKLPLARALLLAVLPYLPLDVAKILLAAGASRAVRRSLAAAGLDPVSGEESARPS